VSARPVVVVGDALLDVDVAGEVRRTSPDAGVPVLEVTGETARPGGAGLAAVLVAGDVPVTLVTAVADDGQATRLRDLLSPALTLLAGPATGGTAVKCRWRSADRPLLRTDSGEGRPGPGFGAAVGDGLRAALSTAGAVLVADYGRGVAADRHVRDALAVAVGRGVPVVWDPHPLGPAPVPGVTVATPNLAEARRFAGAHAETAEAAGRHLLRRWSCAAVAVTVGERGAVLTRPGRAPSNVPAPRVHGGDPCGAGDAFSGALARLLAAGVPLLDATRAAAATAAQFVGNGGAETVRWTGRAFRQPVPAGGRVREARAGRADPPGRRAGLRRDAREVSPRP
jgi:D-beta-D-heptose 7-phosphate kinase / D-beta-D-heptose 1-phosphate adenosyltransferase